MNCANHVDIPATAYCRTCGKPVCAHLCAGRAWRHLLRGLSRSSGKRHHAASAPTRHGSWRGDYGCQRQPRIGRVAGIHSRRRRHVQRRICQGLYSCADLRHADLGGEQHQWLFGLAIAAFVLYMPIEAYQTAKARLLGLQPPDPFGFNNLFSQSASGHCGGYARRRGPRGSR